MNVANKKRKSNKEVRQAIKKQLNYLKRNLGHIDRMMDMFEQGSLPLYHKDFRYLWIINEFYRQQEMMYKNKTHQCDHRIVSLHQHHLRPMVRGKAKTKVEFGSKIGVSLQGGYARIDTLSWDAYNECNDVKC